MGPERIELGTTSLSARPGQPALDYHVFQSGTSESNRPSRSDPQMNAVSCSQSRRARSCTSTRYVFASLRSSPCGSRTLPDWLERPVTSPEVERTVFQNESALAQALFRLGDGPRINANDSSRSAHARVKRFITFTPVVDVSIAQQQAVVQRVFWVWLECPVEHSRLARPASYSGK